MLRPVRWQKCCISMTVRQELPSRERKKSRYRAGQLVECIAGKPQPPGRIILVATRLLVDEDQAVRPKPRQTIPVAALMGRMRPPVLLAVSVREVVRHGGHGKLAGAVRMPRSASNRAARSDTAKDRRLHLPPFPRDAQSAERPLHHLRRAVGLSWQCRPRVMGLVSTRP